MTSPRDRPWFRVAILAALGYPVIGIAFAAFGNSFDSHQAIIGWRLAAWLASAAVFLLHLGHEHFRLHNSPLRAALHVSMAVALGGLGLAVWVNAHGRWVAPGQQSPLAPWALVVFPLVTGLPAFFVALVGGALVDRVRPRTQR